MRYLNEGVSRERGSGGESGKGDAGKPTREETGAIGGGGFFRVLSVRHWLIPDVHRIHVIVS
jgi:hypothetical protein